MKKYIVLFALLLSLGSCTENQRAKKYGGTATIELPAGEKLIVATWKDADLWYLTRERHPGEAIESYTFNEKSNYGILEGTYIIKEK